MRTVTSPGGNWSPKVAYCLPESWQGPIPQSLSDDAQLFRNGIKEGLLTIQELAGSAEGNNSAKCGGWSTQRPAKALHCRGVEASAV